jgi:Major Facilitator Superfamily
MSAERGWRPLSKPAPTPEELARHFQVSPFARLARTHAALAAGDAAVAIALAGSLFFDVDPTSARWKVALYLLLTVTPFTLVAPFVGPVLDRTLGGRRFVVIVNTMLRVVVALLMTMHVNSLLLFPEAFILLVLQKAYTVSKSALVPSVVKDESELVEANSKLGVVSGVVGFASAIPALLLGLAGASAILVYAALIYTVATVLALQLPKTAAARAPAGPLEKAELHSAGVVVAASAMALLRASLGFLTFQIAFVFRRAHYATIWFAMVLVFAALGTLAGNAAGPRLRRVMREETMLIFSLTCAAVLGILAAAVPGRFVAGLLAGGVGFAAASGRLAFDSIVQRDAPAANHGRAFAQFETRFQVAWVLAAFVPILIPIPAAAGFALVGVIAAFAAGSYIFRMHTLRTRGALPERLSDRARRELRRRRARAAGATPDPPDPTNRLPAPWNDPTPPALGSDPTTPQSPLPPPVPRHER